jgi:hypothetical protein
MQHGDVQTGILDDITEKNTIAENVTIASVISHVFFLISPRSRR